MTNVKDKIEDILHLNGCQQRTEGWNEAKDGKEMDMKDMERLESITLEEVFLQTKEYAKERVTSELKRLQKVCESADNEFAFQLANAIEDRVYLIENGVLNDESQ